MQKGSELTEAARKARAAYQREWRQRNADKVRQQQARHWERVAERRDKLGSVDNQNTVTD